MRNRSLLIINCVSEIAVFVDLASGLFKRACSKPLDSMQDYAISKGKVKRIKGINMCRQLIIPTNICVIYINRKSQE